jgi:hypothetical protein
VCLDRLDQVLGESSRDLFLSAAFLVLSAKDLLMSAKVVLPSAKDLLRLTSRQPLYLAALSTYLDEKLAKRGGTIFGLDADFARCNLLDFTPA